MVEFSLWWIRFFTGFGLKFIFLVQIEVIRDDSYRVVDDLLLSNLFTHLIGVLRSEVDLASLVMPIYDCEVRIVVT